MTPTLSETLHLIRQRWPDLKSAADDEPVFLLAAGWRSGSTLLQRMLLAECLVWGEPYGRSGLVDGMARSLCCFSESWPPEDFFLDRGHWEGELGGRWTANLYPPPEHLLGAHVAFFRRLLAEPARRRGVDRWGLKEVRYDMEHAVYLHWLFPRAKFLFLVRNPYACWASFRGLGAPVFFRTWPDEPVATPEQFGGHWLRLARGFAARHREVGGLLVRYEDLAAPEFDAGRIEDYLGFRLDLGARREQVGGSAGKPRAGAEVDRFRLVVQGFAGELGYAPPL